MRKEADKNCEQESLGYFNNELVYASDDQNLFKIKSLESANFKVYQKLK